MPHHLSNNNKRYNGLIELALFSLFASYGHALFLLGQLRYVELALIILTVLWYPFSNYKLPRIAAYILIGFLVTALMNVVSGLYNGSNSGPILARGGTYAIMVLIFPVVLALLRGNADRVSTILIGYSVSYFALLLTGGGISEAYHEIPWRLGAGYAASLALASIFLRYPRLLALAPISFAALGMVDVYMESRAFAVCCFLTAIILLYNSIGKRVVPAKFNINAIALSSIFFVVFIYVSYEIMLGLAEENLLPIAVSQKFLAQIHHSWGILGSARPDTATAIYAAYQRPLLGFGPGIVSPEIYYLYSTLSAESLAGGSNFDPAIADIMTKEWSDGTPNHSHIFGAWADAGVLAAAGWLAPLFLAGYVTIRSVGYYSRWTPLNVIVSTSLVWDVFFSPGPHRLDMVLRIALLVYAYRAFQATGSDGKPTVKNGRPQPRWN